MIKKFEYKNINCCPICNSKEILFLSKRIEILQNKLTTFELIHLDNICQKCLFIFSKLRPKKKFLNKYYKDYYSSFSKIGNDELLVRLKRLNKYAKKNDKIAEIGGGYNSDFSSLLKSKGYNSKNFEINEKIENHNYDIVCHYYVLEHVSEIKKFMFMTNAILKTDGYLIFEIPNFNKNVLASLNNEHINHFSPKNLEVMLNKNNFQLINIKSSSSRKFGLCVVAQKISNRLRKFSKNNFSISSDEKFQIKKKIYNDSQNRLKLKNFSLLNHAKILKRKKIKFCIWGANQNALRFIQVLKKFKINNFDIIDNDIEKRKFKFYSYKVLKSNKSNLKKYNFFFITASRSFETIKNQIKKNTNIDINHILKVNIQ